MKYTTKVKVINYALPVLIVTAFAGFGARATKSLFAQTPPASTTSVAISLPKQTYATGEDVTVTLSNTADVPAYVANHCPGEPLSVYRLEGASWVGVHDTAPDSKCSGEPVDYTVPANRSVRIDYKYWPQLFTQPGVYRIYAAGSSTSGSFVQFTVGG